MASSTRRRNQPAIGPGTIFGLAMTGIGALCLAIGFGVITIPPM